MSASAIFDLAPLGALVRYSDGAPRPPERHVNKLRAWKRRNGQGRLVEKTRARTMGSVTLPASITLHEGDFTSEGVVVLTVRGIHSITSSLRFDVVDVPSPGSVLCLKTFAETDELLHLARDRAAAAAWAASHPFERARFEEVGVDGEPAPLVLHAAAA
jgi:hypothetical protein